MARKPKTIPGPSRLSKILANLNASPRLELSNLQSIKLTLASKNDHFGARHFLKEELPRIRWANPTLDIEVEKVPKTIKEAWKPELELRFTNGQAQTLDLHGKWSTTIVRELMDTAGARSWFAWKEESAATDSPLLRGEERAPEPVEASPKPLPSLAAFRARQGQDTSTKVEGSAPATPQDPPPATESISANA
ncbi:hypothetical protein PC9H_004204 [Pleurotus ostreatus]|uniref:Ribosomal protein/NADH dehydrogenase domain-containing protein n=1 Tax=Pleurotus ostreatus TaxID=5322 RepID=A0A8H6ZZT7_PLEOS|nr:uncharacterized protein PC9H_004204 [Pleurotus ostreatus]KAF7437365.1 hypothetical protein PC9H_004204 [Pleurotus ostreatus]KAJ8703277.1 hypothetical protein PTI98_001914 [Pleurotus ostreatus]